MGGRSNRKPNKQPSSSADTGGFLSRSIFARITNKAEPRQSSKGNRDQRIKQKKDRKANRRTKNRSVASASSNKRRHNRQRATR